MQNVISGTQTQAQPCVTAGMATGGQAVADQLKGNPKYVRSGNSADAQTKTQGGLALMEQQTSIELLSGCASVLASAISWCFARMATMLAIPVFKGCVASTQY